MKVKFNLRHALPALILQLLFASLAPDASAQSQVAAEPVVGLRENRPQSFVLADARVVVSPGQVLPRASVVIDGTSITAVAQQIDVRPGAKTIDCSGLTIYAGLVDAWGEAEVPRALSDAVHWNGNITPQRSARSVAGNAVDAASKLRSQGITVRLVAPQGGIIKGSSCVVLLHKGDSGRKLLRDHTWHHLQLTVPRGSRERYPNSPMGAVALLRQTLYDAMWYRDAWRSYAAKPTLPRPETNLALDVLQQAMLQDTFVIDAPNERMAIRGDQIAREFSLKAILRGSGREYRQLSEVAATGRAVLVPVDFPQPPDVSTQRASRRTNLQELLHWDLAPENPRRLVEAGVEICLTTDGLSDPGKFLSQIRKAVDRGLSPQAALAAVTTVPARLLEIDDVVGQVQPGMLANLVVTDGDLLAAETKVLQTWVAGEQSIITTDDPVDQDVLLGSWETRIRAENRNLNVTLQFTASDNKLAGKLLLPDEHEDAEQAGEGEGEEKRSSSKLKDLVRQRDRLTATVELNQLDDELPTGVTRLTLFTLPLEDDLSAVWGTLNLPDGESARIELRPMTEPDDAANNASADRSDPTAEDPDDAEATGHPDRESEDTDTAKQAQPSVQPTPLLYPLGAYGVTQPITETPHLMFRGATVWTCDNEGVIESGDVIIKGGRIVAVGKNLALPPGCQLIDVRGKHITPGLIDCHSHMGTDGGVNESGQAVTAEVRIGDFIDNSDITIYRQLAGGLTTSNILHGSANPIGGQNQVLKLRWGQTMDGLRMTEAPAGIKFALGENVKRSTSRYPNTRMGVEQIIRDQLLAAREYDAKWKRWRRGDHDSLPPRTDLQLQAMAEVQRGERWIHCHSYRQDEIVATLDVLEEFGVQIGTLQHILEGYKVADRMARHGAMGSSFSDWWAYKFEVYDAIPYNGALMHQAGVVVSFNSDDREIGRRLNTEAAKAVKYGGVSSEEALKFVTLNPARQLRIDPWVGSLAPGKHADLVIWSGRPLSTMTRCEQTWIDGRRYFDLQTAAQTRLRDAQLHARLVQKVLGGDLPAAADRGGEVEEEDRWLRHDVFCLAHGGAEHDYTGNMRNQEQ